MSFDTKCWDFRERLWSTTKGYMFVIMENLAVFGLRPLFATEALLPWHCYRFNPTYNKHITCYFGSGLTMSFHPSSSSLHNCKKCAQSNRGLGFINPEEAGLCPIMSIDSCHTYLIDAEPEVERRGCHRMITARPGHEEPCLATLRRHTSR
jgi:hypothetical protein